MQQMTHLLTWSSSIIIIVSVICSAAPQRVDNRAPLISEFQQRAELARQHLASITEQLQKKEKDVSLIESFRKKMDIRQSFLDRRIDGPEVELRVLEVEAEQRQKTLIPKVELAREELEGARKRVQAGIAESILVAEVFKKGVHSSYSQN
jgi:septal ring factor EnvC (AmiA/AmiB activator)